MSGARADLGEADRLLGRGRAAEALALYEAVLAAGAKDPEILHNRAAALMGLGRPAEALAGFEAAILARPGYVSAHYNCGVVLSALGRRAEAAAAYGRALVFDPGHWSSLNNRGVALMELGRFAEAVESFERALTFRPYDCGCLVNCAYAHLRQGRIAEALGLCQRALDVRPDDFKVHAARGEALQGLGEEAEALQSFERAVTLNPGFAEGFRRRGALLARLKRPEEALESYDRALAIAPGEIGSVVGRTHVLRDLGRPDEALAALQTAAAADPQSVETLRQCAGVLAELGRFDEAAAMLDKAIALAPRDARLHYTLSNLRRTRPDDASLTALQELAKRSGRLGREDRIAVDFALGKAMADIGERAAAFRAFARGAARKRAQSAYDETGTLGAMADIAAAFGEDLIRARSALGASSRAPVFIVGMPRSGSTLIEQILAGHPQVRAAGEIAAFVEAVEDEAPPDGPGETSIAALADLPDEEIGRIGEAYLERIRPLAPEAARITNKMPGNFLYAGLIAMTLPNARILHASRNPVDTCLSCFTTLFARDHPHTYDLRELGRYYRSYATLMDHWRRALPEGVMLDVRYEDVVADLEGQARRIVGHVGLEWDPACLEFHRAERQVRTASVIQVRQPLYSTSVGRWKAYEAHLGPLLQALGRP